MQGVAGGTERGGGGCGGYEVFSVGFVVRLLADLMQVECEARGLGGVGVGWGGGGGIRRQNTEYSTL